MIGSLPFFYYLSCYMEFLHQVSLKNLTFFLSLRIENDTRRNADRRVGEAAAGGNQDPPQAVVSAARVPVNPA